MTAMDPADRPDAHAVQRSAVQLQSGTATADVDPAITQPERSVPQPAAAPTLPEQPTMLLLPPTAALVPARAAAPAAPGAESRPNATPARRPPWRLALGRAPCRERALQD